MKSIKLFVYFLTAVISPGLGQEMPPCSMSVEDGVSWSYFDQHGVNVPSYDLKIEILAHSAEVCYMNTTEIVGNLLLTDDFVQRNFLLLCHKPSTFVKMLPYEGPKFPNIVLFVQISICTTDVASVHNIASLGTLRVLTMFPSLVKVGNSTEGLNNSFSHLNSIASFMYYSSDPLNDSMMTLFDKEQVYPVMAELSLSNLAWTNIPVDFPAMFPNLQSLELLSNNITAIPEFFPWTNQTAALPSNLSRTDLLQNHYALSEYIDVPKNIFRRVFNLENNNVKALCGQNFSGFLQKINLKKNKIEKLCKDAFLQVTGLQNLDLSSNEIQFVPEDVFQRQSLLKKLDLSNNKISTLSVHAFKDLENLQVLNLANNSIIKLKPGTFSNLKFLQQLQLQNNSLTEVDAGSFPVDSVNLQKVYLSNNPLEQLPEFLFWIRGLQHAEVRYTNIRFDNLTNYLLHLNSQNILMSVVDSGSDADLSDIMQQEISPTIIDLSHSKVNSLIIPSQSATIEIKLLTVLLLHFKFILTGNPIVCDCHVNNIIGLIHQLKKNGTITNEQALFDTWICKEPSELSSHLLLDIVPEMTVCPVILDTCPLECECFFRPIVNHTVVDCRSRALKSIHESLPKGKLELLYSGNNITTLADNSLFEDVVILDVSLNKIKSIAPNAFQNMKIIQRVDFRTNLLSMLPESIRKVKAEEIQIFPNPFHCDCNTRWTKQWLMENKDVIKDWHKVACTSDEDDTHVFVDASDDIFVCKDYTTQFDEIRHVVLPSVLSCVIGILAVALIILTYTFRLEIKVLMFIYLGVHPFDGDANYSEEYIDCVIVHSGLQTDWVMEKLVNLLESVSYNFVVCDMARDFVVGFSFQENLTKTVKHSKRILFLISQDWRPLSEKFSVAWGIAQDKMKETRSNFGIIVTHEIKRDEIVDKEINLFMKHGRFVDSSERLFENKVLYYMPVQLERQRNRRDSDPSFLQLRPSSTVMAKCFFNDALATSEKDIRLLDLQSSTTSRAYQYHSFISYGEDLDYVTKTIIPVLETCGLNFCIPDRDFIVGASKEENILQAISSSQKTIFIISQSQVTFYF